MSTSSQAPGFSGGTRLAAVIGHPVRHSFSPAIHNAAFVALGLDWAYLAFDVAPGGAGAAIEAMRTLGLGGMSVTMPHKDDVAAAVDRLDPAAARLGAVNCVAWDGDVLVGHNTDGGGFVASLTGDVAFDPVGRSCAVFGAGGAARAVVAALGDAGAAEVVVVNRTTRKAEAAAALAGSAGRVGTASDLRAADLVVNATSIGMTGNDGLPFDVGLLRSGQVVADLVVFPLRTALLVEAEARGAVPLGGLGMLVHQAADAFALWTGRAAPVDVMRAAVSPP